MNRLAHIEKHLRDRPRVHGRGWMLGEELADLAILMLMPKTQQEIADELGSGWTPRLIGHRWLLVLDELHMPRSGQHLERLALLRLVTGLDPCFCELAKAA